MFVLLLFASYLCVYCAPFVLFVFFIAYIIWPHAKQGLVLGYRFGGSGPPLNCHTSCHTPAPSGRYDNSMAGGRLVCIPYY